MSEPSDIFEIPAPLTVEWDVFVVEFLPPGHTEWRAFSHGTFDTLEQAKEWIEESAFLPSTLVRICRYVGSSSEIRTVVDPS